MKELLEAIDAIEMPGIRNKHYEYRDKIKQLITEYKPEECAKHNRKADVLTCPDCYAEGFNSPTAEELYLAQMKASQRKAYLQYPSLPPRQKDEWEAMARNLRGKA